MCPLTLPRLTLHHLPWWTGMLLLLAAGCGPESGDYGRFDRDPMGTPPSLSKSVEVLAGTEDFLESPLPEDVKATLIEDILQLGPWPSPSPAQRDQLDSAWTGFAQFEGTRVALQGVDSALLRTGVVDRAAEVLTDAFGRWPAHFPDAPSPHLDFAYTGFNFSVYPTDSLLLIGCEFFMGADHPAVRGLPTQIYPRYMQMRMVPEHLIGDALRGWLLVHFQDAHYDRNGRLAEELLYWGKVLYIARCLAPELAPHDLLDWTEEEWKWAQSHERQIWSELRQEDALYTRRRMDIQRWVSDAPFTKAGDVPQDSPDRLGWYMGMRWVEDHMARQKDLDLGDLMAQEDVLPFLQTYRPGS